MPDPRPLASPPRRAAIAGALGALGASALAAPLAFATAPVALPAAGDRAGAPLASALARRRSVRRFGAEPVALAAIAQLLWAAQGLTNADGRRTSPSAGALYPLELHLLTPRVEGLPAAVWRYRPRTHALDPQPAAASMQDLQRAAHGQAAIGAAAVVVAICAVEARTAARYGARAARYVAFEAGAAAQNLLLQATVLGLGAVVVGAFDDTSVARLLGLADEEQPIALLPLGLPA